MSSNVKLSALTKNARLDAITTKVGANGVLNIYSGTQPASPDTAISTQVLLATLALNATFAPPASAGVLTMNAISSGTGSVAAGSGGTPAAWFRITNSGGTAVIDGTVGLTGSDLNINNLSIATGQTVSVASGTITDAN